MNCWEFKKCGREEGGVNALVMGVCPVYPHHGTHCARVVGTLCSGINCFMSSTQNPWDCARVVGTLCSGKVEGAFDQKILSCCDCDFYKSKHYDSAFKELLPY